MQFTWTMGRRLESATRSNGSKVTYTYNADGLLTSKTKGSLEYKYYWNGDKLTAQTDNGSTWYFRYDGDTPIGLEFNGVEYYYVTNLQGDVIAILNDSGECVAEYSYDAWGNCTVTNYTDTIAYDNPLRYRGYYYDFDTGLYYLQSRFYDAKTGRFINADEPTLIQYGAYNLFSYCDNDPINRVDTNGHRAIDITCRLNSLMVVHAKYLYSYAKKYFLLGAYGLSKILYKFYSCVKTGGIWDFKNRKEWKLKKGDYYTFMKVKLRLDDPGNIHFGYVGSVLFSKNTLCAGAGLYQIYSGTSQWKYIKSYFDDPRDSTCIQIGVLLWQRNFRKFVFHF